MMGISFFGLLLIFGGGAVMAATVISAITTRKLWLIPAVVAGMFFGLIMLGLMASIYFGVSRSVAVIQTVPHVIGTDAVSYVQQSTPAQSNFNVHVESSPAWIKLFVVIPLVVFGVILVLRRIVSPHGGHGLQRAWPVLAVLVFIAFMISARLYSEYERHELNRISAQEAAAGNAVRQEFEVNRQRSDRLVKLQKEEQEKQRRALKAQAERQRVIAQGDINELIEQFDQPRIPVSPDAAKPPVVPTPPAPPAPPVATAELTEKAKADANKVAAEAKIAAEAKNNSRTKSASNSKKYKKPVKSPFTPAVVESNSSQNIADSKETKSANSKSAENSVAEAVFDANKPVPRPEWTNESPKRTGNTRREVITTEDFATVDECYQAGDIYLLLKTYQRLEELKGHPTTDISLPDLSFHNGAILGNGKIIANGPNREVWNDSRLRYLAGMGVGSDYVRREIVAKDSRSGEPREFIETVQRTVGPMKRLFLQIEFTPAIDRELLRYWAATQREERFAMFGAGAGTLITLVGLAFALMKFDTFTKGYYTKWLLIGVPTAIIGGIFLFLLVAMH